MSEIYYTDSDRRKFAAQRAAATRKANRERDLRNREQAAIARQEYLRKEAIERPLREKRQAENKSQWLKYWRGRICDAIDTTDADLAAHRIDSLVFEIANWGGSVGFSEPFDKNGS